MTSNHEPQRTASFVVALCVFAMLLPLSCAPRIEEEKPVAEKPADEQTLLPIKTSDNFEPVAKSATASSVQDTNAPATLAIDGDKGTRWSSTFSDPQWLEIDFGEEKKMIGVILYWEVAYASEYAILVSKDRTNWTTAFSTTAGDGGVDNIDFEEAGARYLKIECTRRATAFGHSLYEVTPKTTTEPWGEGEPPDFFLPALLDFRTDPDNVCTPDTADGWT